MTPGAIILAGGQSTRMGRDKAFVTVHGRTLLARQLDVLRAAGAAEIVISGRRGVDYSGLGARVVLDEAPDGGPLAGLLAGLAGCRQSHAWVLAVDLGRMTPEFLRGLRDPNGLTAGGGGVIPRVGGELEPLAALYPAAAAAIAARVLRAGRGAVRDFARDCVAAGLARFADYPRAMQSLFANFNTPADLARWD